MGKVIKVEHPNGYAGVLYGEKSMAVYDPNGHEVMHTGFRNIHTREQLYDYLGRFLEFMRITQEE